MVFRTLLIAGALALAAATSVAAQARVEIGELADGADVALVAAAGGYGLEVAEAGDSRIRRAAPVRVEVFHAETDIRVSDVAYDSVTRAGAQTVAIARVPEGRARIRVEDRYSVSGQVLRIDRTVRVAGTDPGDGFTTGLMLDVPAAHFDSTDYFVPAVLYRGPGGHNRSATVGTAAFEARDFSVREDAMPAPLLGLSFPDHSSVSLLDPAPTGETTEEDTRARVSTVLIDSRFGFGAFGSRAAASGNGVEFGYWFPGGVTPPKSVGGTEKLRYHPLRDGMTQHYELALRFAGGESFPEFERNAWRWAFGVLDPQLTPLDVGVVQRVVYDQLAGQVTTVDGRTGLTWIFQAVNGERWHRPDDMRAAMGFVGKNIEAATLLLREGDRDHSARGQHMRELGLKIIDTFIHDLSMNPPAGDALDLVTGKPTVSFPPSSWRGNLAEGDRLFLRSPCEDLRRLVEAYVREKAQGRDHPEWLAWARQYADWLLPQQRADGAFPRAWRPGTDSVVDASGNSSYSPVPLLADLARVLGPTEGRPYRAAALRAADYIWTAQGKRGVYVGATMDHPNMIDKEAGMLSLEAFLSAYDLTGDSLWVRRAAAAADFTETWMYLWNVPMAVDAIPGELGWKPGAPTTGVGVISVGGGGGVDEFLDWSAPAFARMYKLTGDTHDFDVARILLLDTKSMLALPGRTYDLKGPGWQQENFSLSSRRGYGGHRGWLPWISVNHLWSIVGIEDLDPALFDRLAAKPTR